MNQNLANFLLCGSVGWNMEILWTGFHSLLSGQWTLTGKSSLLMFTIYGCAAIIAPLYSRISSLSFVYRGILYMTGFYLIEFISDSFSWHSASVPGIIQPPVFSTEESYGWTMRLSGSPPDLFLKKYLRNLLEKSILLVYDCAREKICKFSVSKGGIT